MLITSRMSCNPRLAVHSWLLTKASAANRYKNKNTSELYVIETLRTSPTPNSEPCQSKHEISLENLIMISHMIIHEHNHACLIWRQKSFSYLSIHVSNINLYIASVVLVLLYLRHVDRSAKSIMYLGHANCHSAYLSVIAVQKWPPFFSFCASAGTNTDKTPRKFPVEHPADNLPQFSNLLQVI